MTGPETIHQALARGVTIITGNARAARRLQLDYARSRRTLGHTAWPTPPITDWQTWLNNLWQDWAFHHPQAPILLTPLQESALWKTAQGDDARNVVSPESLAALAQQAYSLLCDYEAHASRRQPWTEPDAERFRQWAGNFDRTCTANSRLSPSRLPEHLTAAARDRQLTLPAEILLTGFDRLTPAQQSFLNALKDRNIKVQTLQPEIPEPRIPGPKPPRAHLQALAATSERAELEACAQSLRRQLAANPEARLAVLCTTIEQRRGEIDRVFRRILTPQIDASPDAPSTRQVYEFTLGNPIAAVPAVHAALLALQWLAEPLPQEEVTSLLLSGYLAASPDDLLASARADAALRDHTSLSPLITIHQVLNARHEPSSLCRRLESAHTFATKNNFAEESRLPGAWAELARFALEKFGWPGFRTADSVQFQAQQRWETLLESLALLDISADPIPFSAFLNLLILQAFQTLFAPESLDAPIQIMGPMESAGQNFDAVWFLNATDEQWPATGRAHPLLPIAVQRQAGMPHANPDDDLQLAQFVTQRILAGTAHVTFSRARSNRDGELRPSPIITALSPEQSVSETVTNPPHPEFFLEPWQESPPVAFPGGTAPGGTSVLKHQAACPFQAFANHRLRAEEISQPEWGLTPIDRGNLLHDVLHRFWSASEPRRIETLTDLQQVIADSSLPSILDHHIHASFAKNLPNDLAEPWLLAYLQSEKRRLAQLLEIWLNYEAQRQPFTVEHCEQRLPNVTVGPLQLNLQADRIDQLHDGAHLLIDYKTGLVSTAAWQGDRPDEPQLPLYAVYGNVENVSGLLFAQLRTQNSKFVGRLTDARSQLFDDLKDSSPFVKYPYEEAMHDEWQAALANLAVEFSQGEARVAPKHGEKTCQYCPLPSLCRIHEINEHAEHSLWESAADHDEESEDEDA